MSVTAVQQTAAQLLQCGNPSEASRVLGLALRQAESGDRWNDWAVAEMACGHDVRAEWGYRRALCFDPAHRDAAVNLATLLIAQGRLDESIPLLSPHASTLSEDDKAILRQLTVQPREGRAASAIPAWESPRLLLDAFVTMISLVSEDDPELPGYMREANRRRRFDSKHYVTQCHGLLQQLPERARTLAVQLLGTLGTNDYRLLLVVARHHMDLGDFQAALAVVRNAFEASSYDHYVQRLLIDCELAAAPAESRAQHRWAGLDEYLAGCFCERPWRQLEMSTDSDLHVCCPGWMAAPIGNAEKTSAREAWNSAAVQAVRQSILDGSFKYCSRIHCAWISCRALPGRNAANRPLAAEATSILVDCNSRMEADAIPPESANTLPVIFEQGPRELVLSHDATCNLACPQCRTTFYSANAEQQRRLEKMADNFLRGMLTDATILRLNGSGDVFSSKHGRQLLTRLSKEEYPNLKLMAMTNGLLLDQRTFDELDLWGRLRDVTVSIDAVREETYRIVRRGGDFNRLLANLEFLDDLRVHRGEKFSLGFAFVVSALNFREMPEFVRLSKRFHAVLVGFNFLRNQSGYSMQEFKKLDISRPDHPEYREFLKVLESDELQDPCVGWGSLGHLRPQRTAC